VIVPRLSFDRRFLVVTLHIATPAGAEYTYAPLADRPLRDSLNPSDFQAHLMAVEELEPFDVWLRLADGQPGWRHSGGRPSAHPLRVAGIYRAWFEYAASPPRGAPAGAWSGSVRSDAAAWTVPLFRPEDRRGAPTPQQSAALARFRAQAPAFDNKDYEFLQRELLLAENEGLASFILDLLPQKREVPADGHLVDMVAHRAGSRERDGTLILGIDGPYLKSLASTALAALDRPPPDPNELRLFRGPRSSVLDALLAYLKLHPENDEARARLIRLARRSVRIRILEKPRPGGATWANAGPLSPDTAWTILLDLGVLHAGRPLAEAIEILGQPTGRADAKATVTWYLDSPRHVNPGLAAEVIEGKVLAFRRNSG
jgi:hypothetical protein